MGKYSLENNILLYYDNKDYIGMASKIIEFIWNDQKNDISFELVQDTHKSEVYKFNYDDNAYYLKYYTPIRYDKIIKNQFREVEALRHYNTAKGLHSADILTVIPVLALVKENNFFYKESVFVMEEVKGNTLENYVKKNRPGKTFREEIIKQLADLYAKLANYRILHQDPAFYNFMIREKHTESIELVVIDVDNIYKLPVFPKKAIVYNLVKLYTMFSYDLHQQKLPGINREDINLFISRFIELCNHPLQANRLVDITLKKSAKKLKPYGIKII